MIYKIKHCDHIEGVVKIGGAKNAALPVIASTVLTDEEVTLYNVPIIDDILNMLDIMKSIGSIIKLDKNKHKLVICNKYISSIVINKNVNKLRASYYLMGALIARNKYVRINYPGGCNFSSRPIELHLKSFRLLGIKVKLKKEIRLKRNKLKSNIIYFPIVSVGATINTILASVFIKGTTIIHNASIEPEVVDTINFINSIGGNINISDDRIIQIVGVDKLFGGKYKIMFDRIEAGSYLLLATSIPNSTLTIQSVKYKYMISIINILIKMGCKVIVNKNSIKIESPMILKGCNIEIGPYPNIPTDLQPLLTTTLLRANSISCIKDNIYSDRISHIKELQKLKGNIYFYIDSIIVNPSKLEGCEIYAHDLRCAFALIISSLISEGITTIHNIDYVYRGYEKIESQLLNLGIEIECVE